MPNKPPSEGIKTLITAHAATVSYAIHIGSIPDSPDNVVLIQDSPGLAANPKFLLDFPGIRMVIRGSVGSYLATYVIAKAFKDILLGLQSQDIDGDRWVSITTSGDLSANGQDKDDRPLLTMDFKLIIEPQTDILSNRVAL